MLLFATFCQLEAIHKYVKEKAGPDALAAYARELTKMSYELQEEAFRKRESTNRRKGRKR